MSDLLQRIRSEIQQRLDASRAAVEESERLEAALRALSTAQAPDSATTEAAATSAERAPQARRGPAKQAAGRRAPRGANREAVLEAVRERPGASAGEIAASSGVAQNVVYTQLRRLLAEGVLAKRRLPSGRSGYSPAAEGPPPVSSDADQRATEPAVPEATPTSRPSEPADAATAEPGRTSETVEDTGPATGES
jgi:DNA-binding transcriptional ArsR family regulator